MPTALDHIRPGAMHLHSTLLFHTNVWALHFISERHFHAYGSAKCTLTQYTYGLHLPTHASAHDTLTHTQVHTALSHARIHCAVHIALIVCAYRTRHTTVLMCTDCAVDMAQSCVNIAVHILHNHTHKRGAHCTCQVCIPNMHTKSLILWLNIKQTHPLSPWRHETPRLF